MSRWLDDNNLVRDASSTAEIIQATGGWGELLIEYAEARKHNEHRWSEKIRMLAADWPRKIFEKDCLQLPRSQRTILSKWLTFDGDQVDHQTLVELNPDENVDLFCRWAEELGFISRVNLDHWKPDPIITKTIAYMNEPRST